MPDVSVVIPCYNHGHYLDQALQSVMAQTFTGWEAIVVDDGSTDDTAGVTAGFTDPRIRYIYQDNRGLSAARNAGVRAAQANLIALLDADDYWHPDFLLKMVPVLLSTPGAAAAYCGCHLVDKSGRIVHTPSAKTVPPDQFHQTMVCQGNWFAVDGVMFRKSLAEEVGLFDESLRAVEDTDLWTRLSRKYSFIGLPETLTHYRRHGDNMTNDPDRMVNANLRMTDKNFGPAEGPPRSWPPLKRCAYSRAFRFGVRTYLGAGDPAVGARFCWKLAQIAPKDAESIAFWESLTLAHLPIEHEADPTRVDLAKAATDISALLAEVSRSELRPPALAGSYPRMERAAFVALARTSLRAGNSSSCLAWLGRAVHGHPGALLSRVYWSTVRHLASSVISGRCKKTLCVE